MRDHKKLRAFELADEIALITYRATARFPREETFGLVSQLRRAAISVPSNIVEGCARHSRADYCVSLTWHLGLSGNSTISSVSRLAWDFSRRSTQPASNQRLLKRKKSLAA